ncbi:DUF2384 domain-containing protein [Roseibium sp. CAU 1637]|uniref:DUF2384 domain-containing protein n=1 Tax=Roseibium limicola TaxID=2816037 RepID=A0A939ENY4_9HYPH|nr:antitoxin Xre/MbcA/ParS toxin-binding domain-containing protein [Roseibium limicola]MBO0346019.1 DUF2384 domain-containing protein [Roseibium limicola]
MTTSQADSDLFWNHVRAVGRRLEAHFRPEKSMEWVCTPHPELGNRAPAALVAQGRVELVLELIDKMDERS